MYVKEIWRYPVKSMAGEQLERAHLAPLGIDGDRVILVLNAQGRIVTPTLTRPCSATREPRMRTAYRWWTAERGLTPRC